MQTDKKNLVVIAGLLLCGILILGFYWAGHIYGASGLKDNLPQTGSVHPSVTTQLPDTDIITVNPIPEYPAGKTIIIRGTTTLPVGQVLDIAWIKEPYHTTKCDPDMFCGSGTYSTNVTAGDVENVWSFALNTSGFTEGGYSIWVVAKNRPNSSVDASFYLRQA
ncbi:hypothetical protein [Methanoregula formicica]|uniref:Uncharacterized protein n=1 Tax=Methanoregula formicica (strain DSM 22288 / NBRC 105244 / SMSP) TaxID=593750 RepID=L0HEQ6_METFS|nr:hypothetical protein [Methanoregula formicica]AGB02256.1 hypothetical protein Metfor_1213 [Methanoregula formicica SMSP]